MTSKRTETGRVTPPEVNISSPENEPVVSCETWNETIAVPGVLPLVGATLSHGTSAATDQLRLAAPAVTERVTGEGSSPTTDRTARALGPTMIGATRKLHTVPVVTASNPTASTRQ